LISIFDFFSRRVNKEQPSFIKSTEITQSAGHFILDSYPFDPWIFYFFLKSTDGTKVLVSKARINKETTDDLRVIKIEKVG
jgi:hypothetical protein